MAFKIKRVCFAIETTLFIIYDNICIFSCLGCPNALIFDIIFLLDDSGSVGERDYKKALAWINSVTSSFR